MPDPLMFQDPETFKRIMMMQQQNQMPYAPQTAMSPTPTLQSLYGGENPALTRTPDAGTPWGQYAMLASMGAAPVANAVISNRQPQGQLISAPSVGGKSPMDIQNFYAMFKGRNPGTGSALSRLLRNK